MRGSIRWRCSACIRQGTTQDGDRRCSHKEGAYNIVWRYGSRQHSKRVGPVKKDAERLLSKIISQIQSGSYHEPERILFKNFTEKWLEDYARGHVKPSTFRNYRNMLRNCVCPALGYLEISQVTTYKIQNFQAELLKTRDPNTVLKYVVLLKTVFKHARKWGFVRENPALDVERPRVERKDMEFLTPHEIKQLLKASEEPFKTLFMTAVLTGLRRGEVLALQWGDIDWQSNLIHVRRSVYMLSQGEAQEYNEKRCWKFITPKSKRSVRRIIMSPILREALDIHRLNSPGNPYDLVFANRKGEPLDGQNLIHRYFYPTLEAAGMRKVNFHALRHTYCSLLLAQNENVKFIQSQLGHASITTTIDRYGHLMPQDNAEAGLKLDKQVFGSANILPTNQPEMALNTT